MLNSSYVNGCCNFILLIAAIEQKLLYMLAVVGDDLGELIYVALYSCVQLETSYFRNTKDTFAMQPLNCPDYSDPKFLKGGAFQFMPDKGGIGKVFFDKMVDYGDATAQINGLTSEKDSYKSLVERCIRTAVAMRSRGITSEDVITVCSFNHLNSCVPFIAALFLGAKPANLDPTIALTETTYLLELVKPKMVFVGPEAVELIEKGIAQAKINAEIVVFGHSKNYSSFSEFLKPSDEEHTFQPITIEDDQTTAAIFFSSGTTGLPKGMCLNHFTLLNQGYMFHKFGYNMQMFLSFTSLYWISATVFLTATILSKGCRILISKCDPADLWKLIENFGVTAMCISPFLVTEMAKNKRPKEYRSSSLKQILVGGSPVSCQQIKVLRDVLPETSILLAYGMTELGGASLIFQPKKSDDMRMACSKPESSGRPVYEMIYKVVDINTGEILGPNQKGELRLKTKLQLNGYYKQDSSDIWDSDGFIKTGDLVYYDQDSCFYIVDRIKEMLKFQSWHVSPGFIEDVLFTHPAVAAAAVVGLPHPIDGDHPAAAIVLKNSFKGKIGCGEIEKYVEERVSDRMRLRGGVRIVDDMPLTPSGKIKKREIRAWFAK